jgi:DinB family protein
VWRGRPVRVRAAEAFCPMAAVAQTALLALSFSPTGEINQMKQIFLIPAALLIAALATAQTMAPQSAPQTAAATPTKIDNPIASALRDAYPNRSKFTLAAVDAMPADKFNYKPSADQMTFGHLVAHMIEANYGLCSGATSVAAPKVDKANDTDGKDKLLAALKASFDFCGDALSKMDDSKLGEIVTGPGGQSVSRGRYALGVASNWADHYAEAAMYLRQNGILPPTAKK